MPIALLTTHMRRHSTQGFTLVELMVVVSIIGTVLMAAMPAMYKAMDDRRVAQVAREVVRVYQSARYKSMAYGRAHSVVYWEELVGDEPFIFETYRGLAPDCMHNDWTSLAGGFTSADCENRTACVDSLRASDYDSNVNDDEYTAVLGWNNLAVCYESGSTSTTWFNTFAFGALWLSEGLGKAGLGFAVTAVKDGNHKGVTRKIFVPWGTGSPRILR